MWHLVDILLGVGLVGAGVSLAGLWVEELTTRQRNRRRS